jgi:hypothetical protein
MNDPKDIDRRTLLGSSLAFAALALSGCGGSGEDGGSTCHRSGATGGTDACTFTMTGDHMHGLLIPPPDVKVGNDKTYALEDCGTGHTHALKVTAYDFLYLQAGATQPVESAMTNGHTHTVSIACPKTT